MSFLCILFALDFSLSFGSVVVLAYKTIAAGAGGYHEFRLRSFLTDFQGRVSHISNNLRVCGLDVGDPALLWRCLYWLVSQVRLELLCPDLCFPFRLAPLVYELTLMVLAIHKAAQIRTSLGIRGLKLVKTLVFGQLALYISYVAIQTPSRYLN